MESSDELELVLDFHLKADRQGPGSSQDTLRALSFVDLKQNPTIRIADIGCGAGAQTFDLANNLNAHIVAVDIFPEFLDELKLRLGIQKPNSKIEALESSMENLPFGEEELDMIWSEGAIYNMGFSAGIQEWKKFLKPGGYIAVSEITWLTHNRPKEIEDYWNTHYPEIDTASNKINVLEENGFMIKGYFPLGEDSWLNNYYLPMENRIDSFLEKHNHSDLARQFVEGEKEEIQKYKTFKDFYSYGFYIGKKI